MFAMCLVDSPTRVYVNLLIRSISKIDDYKMVSGNLPNVKKHMTTSFENTEFNPSMCPIL